LWLSKLLSGLDLGELELLNLAELLGLSNLNSACLNAAIKLKPVVGLLPEPVAPPSKLRKLEEERMGQM
jgi:hypothetical protein